MTFSLNKANRSDIPYLLALRLATMGPHFKQAGIPLTEQDHLDIVEEAFDCAHIIYAADQKAGLLKYRVDDNETHIIQLQIDPTKQGQGLGKSIVCHVIDAAKPNDVTLNVLKQNPAKQLYERLGFVIEGEDAYEFHMRYRHSIE